MATLAKALISPSIPAKSRPKHLSTRRHAWGQRSQSHHWRESTEVPQIGSGTIIHSQAFIGRDAIIGENVEIHPGAKVLERCHVGNGVILQAGAVIGSDGFGYAPDNEGTRHKIPQVGIVVLKTMLRSAQTQPSTAPHSAKPA